MSADNEADVVRSCAEALKKLEKDRPWMTASALAGRLSICSANEIEVALRRHAERGASVRRVRYCHYPSKRSVSILWGHVCNVGESRVLPPLELVIGDGGSAIPSRSGDPEAGEPPAVFISHNSRDADTAIALKRTLRVSSWICGEEIEPGDTIIHEVQQGLANSRGFVSLVTKRSIGSVWVRKELSAAMAGLLEERRVFIVMKEGDPVFDAIQRWRRDDGGDFFHAIVEVAQASSYLRNQTTESSWVRRAGDFADLLMEYWPDRLAPIVYTTNQARKVSEGDIDIRGVHDLAAELSRQQVG